MPNFGKTTIRNRIHLLKSVFDDAEEIVIGYQVYNLAKLQSNNITFGDFNDNITYLVGNKIELIANESMEFTANDFILNGNLTVNGTTTLKSTLNVTGKSTLGELEAGTTTLKSTLDVTGTTTLNDTLIMNSNIDLGSNALYVGNETILGIKYGTKNIDGIKNTNGLLIGDLTESGNTSFTIIGNDCKMAYSLYVKDHTTLESTLDVAGMTTLNNKIILNKSYTYGDSLPSTGTVGQVFFLLV